MALPAFLSVSSSSAPAAAAPSPPASLRVLVAASEPFCYRNAQGETVGYECAILKSFAETSGRALEIEWMDVELAELLSRLESGEGDVAAAALTITPERLQRFAFTRGHFPTLMVLVERRGEESRSFDDLQGKRIIAERGSSYETVLRKISGVEIVYPPFESYRGYFRKIADGRADALAIDSAFFLWNAEDFPSLTLTLALSEREYYGFALRPDDPLKTEIDAHVDLLKESGKLREFLREAFGEWGEGVIDDMADGFLDGD